MSRYEEKFQYNTLSPYGHLIALLKEMVKETGLEDTMKYLEDTDYMQEDNIVALIDGVCDKAHVKMALSAMSKYPVTLEGEVIVTRYNGEVLDTIKDNRPPPPVMYGTVLIYHGDSILLEERDNESKLVLPMKIHSSSFWTDPLNNAYAAAQRHGINAYEEQRQYTTGLNSVPLEDHFGTLNMHGLRDSRMFVLVTDRTRRDNPRRAAVTGEGYRGVWVDAASIPARANEIDPDALDVITSVLYDKIGDSDTVEAIQKTIPKQWDPQQPRNIIKD